MFLGLLAAISKHCFPGMCYFSGRKVLSGATLCVLLFFFLRISSLLNGKLISPPPNMWHEEKGVLNLTKS